MPEPVRQDPALKAPETLDDAKIAAARLWACTRWPYLAKALLAMQPVASPGLGRWAIDEGWRIYLDPAIVDGWTASQLGFVLNHVAQHLLRDHAGRARGFGVTHDERLAWNAAADIEINDDLVGEIKREDRIALAPLTPKQIDLEPGKLAEYYYTRLRETGYVVADEGAGVHGQAEDGPGQQSDQQNGPEDTNGTAPEGVSAAEAEMLRQATADALMAEEPGTAPAGLQRWAQARQGRVQDWRSLLAVSLRNQANRSAGLADYSYRRLSRRAGAVPDVVLPAMVKSPFDVAIVIDTSGSVREADLGDALRETRSIVERVSAGGGSVQVLACDAVASRVSTAPDSAMALTGGGGTDMAAGIEAALAEDPCPQAVVVLTDGLTPWPETEPQVPVIIGLIGGRSKVTTPTWATTIEIEQAAT